LSVRPTTVTIAILAISLVIAGASVQGKPNAYLAVIEAV